jgi:hypothetical protein
MRKLAISLLLGCAACTTGAQAPRNAAAPQPVATPAAVPQPPATPTAPQAQSDTLGQIRALVGAAGCTDSSQCHSLPMGARGCGGPQGYLAWSSAHTPGDALRALGERYKAERQAQIAAAGEMSDCRFVADPGAVCRAGSCQLGSAGAAAQ